MLFWQPIELEGEDFYKCLKHAQKQFDKEFRKTERKGVRLTT